jgi:hypothetical protein
MSRLSYNLLAAAAVIALAVPAMAQEAGPGEIGEESYGTSTITVTIPELVQITGVDNISFEDLTYSNLTNGVTVADEGGVCVFSNTAGRGYTITATGNGTEAPFSVTNGESELIYSVRFNEGQTPASGAPLTHGTQSQVFEGDATTYGSAGGCTSANASFDVTFAAGVLQDATAGGYTGTLTLTVSPAVDGGTGGGGGV